MLALRHQLPAHYHPLKHGKRENQQCLGARNSREIFRVHSNREKVHRRHGLLRGLVLHLEQLHLLSRHPPAIPDILRLGRQDQFDRHFLHGCRDRSTNAGG